MAAGQSRVWSKESGFRESGVERVFWKFTSATLSISMNLAANYTIWFELQNMGFCTIVVFTITTGTTKNAGNSWTMRCRLAIGD